MSADSLTNLRHNQNMSGQKIKNENIISKKLHFIKKPVRSGVHSNYNSNTLPLTVLLFISGLVRTLFALKLLFYPSILSEEKLTRIKGKSKSRKMDCKLIFFGSKCKQ